MAFNTASPEYSANTKCGAKYTAYNQSAPGANTAIVSGGIVFSASASACRVTVALTTSSVFNVTCTNGSTPHKWAVNDGTALGAARIYTFTFAVRKTVDGLAGGTGLTWNFEVATDSVIEVLFVEEVLGGVV